MSRLTFKNQLKEKDMRDIFKLAMTLAVVGVLAVFPTSCNNATVCSVETVASNIITSAVASPLLLNCNSQGYATIQATAQAILDKYGACGSGAAIGAVARAKAAAKSRGVIAATICQDVETAVNSLIASAVPTGCSPVIAAPFTALEGVALAACDALPF
jgi:hypothetical protein